MRCLPVFTVSLETREREIFLCQYIVHCTKYFYTHLGIVWCLYLPKAMALTHVAIVLAAGYELSCHPFCISN